MPGVSSPRPISAIPSPYSQVLQPAATFAPRLRFFPAFSRPLASRSIRESSFSSLLSLLAYWPAYIGKYEYFVSRPHCPGPVFATGTHAKPVPAFAYVRACGCLLAGGDKDRSRRVVHPGDEKNREAATGANRRGGGLSDERVVLPNDDIQRVTFEIFTINVACAGRRWNAAFPERDRRATRRVTDGPTRARIKVDADATKFRHGSSRAPVNLLPAIPPTNFKN